MKQQASYRASHHGAVAHISASCGMHQCRLLLGFSRMAPPPRSMIFCCSSRIKRHAQLSLDTRRWSSIANPGSPMGCSWLRRGAGARRPSGRDTGIDRIIDLVLQSSAANCELQAGLVQAGPQLHLELVSGQVLGRIQEQVDRARAPATKQESASERGVGSTHKIHHQRGSWRLCITPRGEVLLPGLGAPLFDPLAALVGRHGPASRMHADSARSRHICGHP